MKVSDDINDYLTRFEQEHFFGEALPDDLRKLMAYEQSNGVRHLFKAVDVGLRQLGKTNPLISHDYINATDRTNPDTMANVQAMNEITDNMGVVAFGDFAPEGAIGFWPMDRPDRELFSLDTEGQYHLCLGTSFSETLYFETIVNDYDAGKVECETLFQELDIPFNSKVTKDEIWTQVDERKFALSNDPQKQRDARFLEIISEPDKIIGYTPLPEPSANSPFWRFWKGK